ncbi:MAG: GIY-YIG nuclease family protein [Candidatus Margulisbacteria bacterium]|nr:GIY-YIG nuclease family protein [Candidatus Margulisiibacteriota bacterium]
MPYYVYIIECSNKALYTGITLDLKRRFKQHQTGKGGHFTAYNPAVKLKYSERHRSRSAAAKREYQIKTWPRAKKLALIKSEADQT